MYFYSQQSFSELFVTFSSLFTFLHRRWHFFLSKGVKSCGQFVPL